MNIIHQDLPNLFGSKCMLIPLSVNHVSNEYLSWLNDQDTNKYLESRFLTHTLESTRQFISSQLESGLVLFYGIWSFDQRHIGNIKLGPIDKNHLSADMGFLIGDKNFRGYGIATQAITLLSQYGFSLGLKKITAGVYEENIGSIKALQNSNFKQEGLKMSQVVSNGRRMNVILFGYSV